MNIQKGTLTYWLSTDRDDWRVRRRDSEGGRPYKEGPPAGESRVHFLFHTHTQSQVFTALVLCTIGEQQAGEAQRGAAAVPAAGARARRGGHRDWGALHAGPYREQLCLAHGAPARRHRSRRDGRPSTAAGVRDAHCARAIRSAWRSLRTGRSLRPFRDLLSHY